MRAAMTRRSLSASEAIDEVDSPVDGLEDGSLSIPSQTTGNVTDVWRRTTAITRRPLPQDGSIIVRFEIPFAHVMPPPNENENSTIKKYVVYDLNIRQDSNRITDANPVTIERRYTDFLKLYDGLRTEYSAAMNTIPFPKKAFLGNFSSALIAERSAAFEALLDHIMSVSDLRESPTFLEFLRDIELTKACRLLDERRNELAIPILEDCFRLLNKIFMDRSKSVLLLLCRLVAACTTSPVPHPSAEKWAELALRRYDSVSDADLLTLYIPLLNTCVHLWWQRGRDNQYLQDRLKAMECKGIPVKNGKTLTQAIHALDPRTETV
ncbi:sorting nexin-21 [Sitodiplosis mosellana]|uniref:sorting nexin-21 n=1 Tax=Sitodiplosis mosellana TaxID=263140 RepID=UPI0024448B8D|nr:sorting nexin-21 [Sitodiplosis mosellana]